MLVNVILFGIDSWWLVAENVTSHLRQYKSKASCKSDHQLVRSASEQTKKNQLKIMKYGDIMPVVPNQKKSHG